MRPGHTPLDPAGPLPVLVGPTAVGKTEVALELAEGIGAEILSVDSRQVYRRLDIGTAKPTPEERARVRHHLLDLVEPAESLSAGEFARRFRAAEAEVRGRGREVLAVGGSGLYFRAVTHGLFEGARSRPDLREAWLGRSVEDLRAELLRVDPHTAARLTPRDRQRIVRALEVFHDTGRPMSELHAARPGTPRRARMVVLTRPRAELYQRIHARLERMLERGLEQEARRVWEMRLPPSAPAARTVGYREWFAYFEGSQPRDSALDEIRQNTRRYAKRQLTWFRAQPEAAWVEAAAGESGPDLADRIRSVLAES